VAARIGQRYLPALRELFLGDFDSEETEMSWSELGDIGMIYPSLPNLKSLRLRSGSMELGKIVLPELAAFTVETGGLNRDNAKAIAYARWPGLERLSIQIGSPNYDGDASIDELQAIALERRAAERVEAATGCRDVSDRPSDAAELEPELALADADDVALGEARRVHHLTVDRGAVRGLEIGEPEATRGDLERCMPA
jgi:hypothetical protein